MKLKLRRLMIGVCGGLFILMSSCIDDGPPASSAYDQWIKDIETIDNYLVSEGLTAVKNRTGVRMVITKLGEKLPALLDNTVNIDYIGKVFSTSATFDQGNTKLKVSQYIDGWQDALTTLPEGSEAKLFIPAAYGYGNQVKGTIPANSILTFDIRFNDVVESSQEIQRLTADTVAIGAYLDSKNIDAIKDTTGIRYVITTPGAGPRPSWYNGVKIKYTIKLLTNETFIATLEHEPTNDFLSRVVDYIHGMKIGLQKLSAGSKATLYIPSGLAFGVAGSPNNSGASIPANANIIIEIELIDIL